MKQLFSILLGGMIVMLVVFYFFRVRTTEVNAPQNDLSTNMTLAGTYECLPSTDPQAPPATDCVFGLRTDTGEHYLVNFGQSASAKEQFDQRAHVRAEGFFVPKEALNTDQWVKYNMNGIFTITRVLTTR